jgi:hypothetical protein
MTPIKLIYSWRYLTDFIDSNHFPSKNTSGSINDVYDTLVISFSDDNKIRVYIFF